MYKRANRLGGPVGFVDLAHASVMVADRGNPRQFLVVTGSRMFRIRALSKNARSAWTRCLKGSADAYSAAVALVRDRRLRYESQERGGGRLAGPLIPADVKSTEAAAAEAKQKLSALSREELLERCAELEVQNARLGLRLAASSDGSASSDTEDDDGDDDCDDGGSESGSSEYGSVASFASAHTSTFAQDSETSMYVQAVEVINRHDFAVATFTGDNASRGGTPVTGRGGDGRARRRGVRLRRLDGIRRGRRRGGGGGGRRRARE